MHEADGELIPARLAGQRWVRRPFLSALVRVAVLALPIAAAMGAGIALSGALAVPRGLAATIGWYAATLAASLFALVVVDRMARRFLPLAVLLRVTLVFPDRAPSRLAVALGASSRSRLAAQLARARDADVASDVEALVTLAAALNSHDRRTRGHSERVRALTDLLGEELGLSCADADRLRWAAFLHDIGKLRVSTRVLNKRGPLTAPEWRMIERHPAEGAAMAGRLRPWLGEWLDAIDQHHERYDGRGYPHGLQRQGISLSARLVAVADSFETMTAVRSYNKPKTVVAARHELVRCAGTHFDPRIVRHFLGVSLGRLRWRIGLAAWIAELPLIGVPTRASAQLVTTAAAFESTSNALIGAVVFSVAGVATPGVPALASHAPSLETHAVTATVQAGGVNPAGSPVDPGPAGIQAVPTDKGAVRRPGNDSPPSGPPASSAPGDPAAGSRPPQAPEAPGAPDFVPPGHGGQPPGLTRITPGRNGAIPPGHGGTPPGFTGSTP